MAVESIPKIGKFGGLEELPRAAEPERGAAAGFSRALEQAIDRVDRLQKESDVAQAAYVGGADVDLHDVLIKVEEAEVAFRAMMEVRNKLIDAYREVMRMGG